jgi:hypothetical protein
MKGHRTGRSKTQIRFSSFEKLGLAVPGIFLLVCIFLYARLKITGKELETYRSAPACQDSPECIRRFFAMNIAGHFEQAITGISGPRSEYWKMRVTSYDFRATLPDHSTLSARIKIGFHPLDQYPESLIYPTNVYDFAPSQIQGLNNGGFIEIWRGHITMLNQMPTTDHPFVKFESSKNDLIVYSLLGSFVLSPWIIATVWTLYRKMRGHPLETI